MVNSDNKDNLCTKYIFSEAEYLEPMYIYYQKMRFNHHNFKLYLFSIFIFISGIIARWRKLLNLHLT